MFVFSRVWAEQIGAWTVRRGHGILNDSGMTTFAVSGVKPSLGPLYEGAILAKCREAELRHARWAMLATLGRLRI